MYISSIFEYQFNRNIRNHYLSYEGQGNDKVWESHNTNETLTNEQPNQNKEEEMMR